MTVQELNEMSLEERKAYIYACKKRYDAWWEELLAEEAEEAEKTKD